MNNIGPGGCYGGGGVIGRVVEAASERGKKQIGMLAKRFPGALERKDPQELGKILKEVKSLNPTGERQFLSAVLGARGDSSVEQARAAGQRDSETFRDLVTSSLSPEQRQSLARELLSPLAHKLVKPELLAKLGGKPGLPPPSGKALEASLDKFLGSLGKESPAVLAGLKDEMVKLPGWMQRKPAVPHPQELVSAAQQLQCRGAEQPVDAQAEVPDVPSDEAAAEVQVCAQEGGESVASRILEEGGIAGNAAELLRIRSRMAEEP